MCVCDYYTGCYCFLSDYLSVVHSYIRVLWNVDFKHSVTWSSSEASNGDPIKEIIKIIEIIKQTNKPKWPHERI